MGLETLALKISRSEPRVASDHHVEDAVCILTNYPLAGLFRDNLAGGFHWYRFRDNARWMLRRPVAHGECVSRRARCVVEQASSVCHSPGISEFLIEIDVA